MAGYLLDTNHLGLAVRPNSLVRKRIRRVKVDGSRFGTCIPALCELEIGIRQVRDPDLYRKTLARLLGEIRIWPLDQGTSRVYAEIYEELRRAGCVLSQVDMMIAAMARLVAAHHLDDGSGF